jgi:hypothetical protein
MQVLLCLVVLGLMACSTATESRDQSSRVGSLNQVRPTLPLRPVTKVTHVIETTYYPVNGVTTTEIFKFLAATSINPKALSLGGDTFTAGLAEFEPLFTYSLEEGDSCSLSSARLAVNSTVPSPCYSFAFLPFTPSDGVSTAEATSGAPHSSVLGMYL